MTLLSCGRGDRKAANPLVVVGIDGASWPAIRDLWREGRLPNLKALADRGIQGELQPIADASPVVWTTMATGVRPVRHGITDFVLPTTERDVPVSSSVRRVPAIWNMISAAKRTVAVVGWWASWPAEKVNGVVVSDRVHRGLERDLFPQDFTQRFQTLSQDVPPPGDESFLARAQHQDRLVQVVSQDLAADGYDLMLVYFRGPDLQSHLYWKHFREPESGQIPSAKVKRLGERVPEAYEAVDRAIGDLISTAPANTNFIVVSDHGFESIKGEEYRMWLDLNEVLERLGYLERTAEGDIDWNRSSVVTWNSPPNIRTKTVRFGLTNRQPGGPVATEDLEELTDRLSRDLDAIVYDNGNRVFRVQEPTSAEIEEGADLRVKVFVPEVSRTVFYRGEELENVVNWVEELTGTHSAENRGIFIAAGPDIDQGHLAKVVRSPDITPTILHAMKLPVAHDFDGRPRLDCFRPEFRRAHPVSKIATWGNTRLGAATSSAIDDEIIRELTTLGYLN